MGLGEVRLRVLEQGSIEAENAVFLTDRGKPELVSATWPVRCYLVDHPGGLLLWDAGLPEAALATDPLALSGWSKRITAPLLPSLGELGIAPRDITYAGFSHLHIDHAGNANAFAGSTVLLGAREHAHAFGPDARNPYRPADYAPLRESRTILVDDRYDVFGDGAVVIVAAPGHSPGHQVLVLTLPGQEPLILVGDAFYAPEDLARRRIPQWNSDPAESFRSMDRIEQMAAEIGARLLIHHDPNA
jgi:N-acyl homoserine lactone hydrolase